MSYYWAYQAAAENQPPDTDTGGPPTPGPGGRRCPRGEIWDDIAKVCKPRECSVPANWDRFPADGCPRGYFNRNDCCRPRTGGPPQHCGHGRRWDWRKRKCVPISCLPWEWWDHDSHKCRGPWPPKCPYPYVWDWPDRRCSWPPRWPRYKPIPHVVNEDIDINVDITGEPSATTGGPPTPGVGDLSGLLQGSCAGLPIPCGLLMIGGIGALIAVAMIMKK